jgi:HEAT repeat protein
MLPSKGVLARIDALNALNPTSEQRMPQVERALRDRSPLVREFAVRFVEEHRLLRFIPNVEACLTARNWLLRTQAAVSLGELLEPNGKPQYGLRKLLKDKEWVVRIDAMESLAMLEDRGSMPQIAKLLKDENGIVRSYAATNLAEKCGHTYKPKISKLLQTENDPHARVGFLAALFRMGDPHLLPQLLDLLQSEVYQIRCAVIHHLEDLPLSEAELATVIKTFLKLRRKEPTIAVKSTITTALKILRNSN